MAKRYQRVIRTRNSKDRQNNGPLFCLSFELRLLITLCYLLAIVLSVLRVTGSDYPLVSFGHCFVCPSSYGFWLPFGIFWPLFCLSFQLRLLITLWYLLAIVLSVLPVTASYYPFGIFWPLFCLSFELRLLITLWYLLAIVLSVLRVTASDYPFGIFWPLFCLSFQLRLLITLWFLLALVLSFWKDRQNNGQQIPNG
jgi:carbon starvation protein CstA